MSEGVACITGNQYPKALNWGHKMVVPFPKTALGRKDEL